MIKQFLSQDDLYRQHEARRWNRQSNKASAQFSRYGSWYSSFAQELDMLHYTPHVSWPYEFVMELFDTGHDPEWAARLFVIAQYERYARQREAAEEEILSQFSHPLIGHDFLYHRDDVSLTIINHRGRRKIYATTTPEYRYTDLYLKHYFPDAKQINSRADLYETANNRHVKYMEGTR